MNEKNWDINFKLASEDNEYILGGFGMKENASLSKDDYDQLTPPAFLDFLEINFTHKEYYYSKFTKDIVPSNSEYIWEFSVDAQKEGIKNLSWNNSTIREFGKNIMLYDTDLERVIDMKQISNYIFQSKTTKSFKVYFGSESLIDASVSPSTFTLDNAYPNPSFGLASFSVELPNTSDEHFIDLSIYNSFGEKVYSLAQGSYKPGFYEFSWNGYADGQKKYGLHICQLMIYTSRGIKVISKKLILQ